MSLPYSCHIFMFPFQWSIKEMSQQPFSEQIAFKNISTPRVLVNWERDNTPEDEFKKELLFNEKNYFYKFIHDSLYDNGKDDNTNIVRQYRRTEPGHQDVFYEIETSDKTYKLKVTGICLNLYSTGVGVLTFSMSNNEYKELPDILKINQFGRRVYPPFYHAQGIELAQSLGFIGLNSSYSEDFQSYKPEDSNKPAAFLLKMVKEVAQNINIEPVIDDRMYSMSWFRDNDLAKDLCKNFKESDNWYRYVFVDGGLCTCQNDELKKELIKEATYSRWTKWNSIYGISRYSFVMLSNAGEDEKHLYDTFETIYARMAELTLVQKASVLRFSAEVTNISSMEENASMVSIPERTRSLYKEYIRFINQIHFREVSAQDQAIELYNMLYKNANLEEQTEKLDNEIGELHQYASLIEDKETNRKMSFLSFIATIFVPATFVAGVFGMNNSCFGDKDDCWNTAIFQIGFIIASVILFVIICKIIYKLWNNK